MTEVWDAHRHDHDSALLAYSTLAEVQANMARTGFPAERTRFVQGDVGQTIPGEAPERIALLRLDTDWYESTRHELEHLYPRLQPGGVLIVDDYGHWAGAREAVDEYFAQHGIAILLNRIDYTGRIAVKPVEQSR
jgi:predicted O-methyltransferase YrrM